MRVELRDQRIHKFPGDDGNRVIDHDDYPRLRSARG